MQIGVVFPQNEFFGDAAGIRAWTEAVAARGFRHVLAYDHVLGADPDRPGGWKGPYTYEDPFLSPFLLFSYMSAIAPALGYVTGIIILPQRETALVAKQAASLDVLCAGKFRLGVGVGWNAVEYEALNQDFHTRGRRQTEQVELMQRLWQEPLVTYRGEWHTITAAGLNPLPIQQPIPLWFGGHADAVLRRMARLGAGWLPNYRTPEKAREAIETLHRYLAEEGRDPDSFGMEPRLLYREGPAVWRERLEGWQEAGATHLSLNTMYGGLQTVQEHIDAVHRFADAVGEAWLPAA